MPNNRKIFLALLYSVMLLSACESPEDALTRISKHGTTSHNPGQDCTQIGCHDDNSNIRFSYAGTVFKNSTTTQTGDGIPNATIYFYQFDGADNIINATQAVMIEGDVVGNFYTTEKLSLNYPNTRPCFFNPLDTSYYCMPTESDLLNTWGRTAADVNSHSCSNSICHLGGDTPPSVRIYPSPTYVHAGP